MFASDRGKFGNLQALTGREVQVRGTITPYDGRAEIIVHNPGQLRLAP
jgi:DNA/RNA endonuclease YhcR with UshA esterase domain